MKKILFVLALLLVSGGVALAETPNFSINVSGVSDTKATLKAEFRDCCDGDADSTNVYYFEYGTTTSVVKRTDNVTLAWHTDANEPFATSDATIRGLRPDTKYYYRFVQKNVNLNSDAITYEKSELESFQTLDINEEPDEEDTNELTDAQIEGLEDLGFTQTQIDKIVRLFEKKVGPQGLACGYRHNITLRNGMSGENIREMQKALKLSADGKFGRLTAEAVKRFQAEHGLQADGIVGRMTGLKLRLLCHAE